jgi:hypothetical protein
MLKTMNNLIACTPFPKQHMEKVVKGGFAMVDKKVNLQELEVVMFADYDKSLNPGTKVFVRGDAIVQNWAKEVFTQDGVEFILVPASAIQYIKGDAQWQSGC